jgi:hypothetical protein
LKRLASRCIEQIQTRALISGQERREHGANRGRKLLAQQLQIKGLIPVQRRGQRLAPGAQASELFVRIAHV